MHEPRSAKFAGQRSRISTRIGWCRILPTRKMARSLEGRKESRWN
jgi:hypothetical protein